jgi:hypothetical protein
VTTLLSADSRVVKRQESFDDAAEKYDSSVIELMGEDSCKDFCYRVARAFVQSAPILWNTSSLMLQISVNYYEVDIGAPKENFKPRHECRVTRENQRGSKKDKKTSSAALK